MTEHAVPQVIVADAIPGMSFDIERGVIEGAGYPLVLTRAKDEDGLIENLREADAILVLGAQITRRVIEGMPRCQLIVRYGVGLDSLDVPAATDHGIVVAHFPDFCMPEVANHAILLLLASAKKLMMLDRTLRSGGWRVGALSPMGAIHGETLGLVAFGNIAQAVATRAQALGLQVIAFDPYAKDETFQRLGVERVASLDALLARSDYVSIHTPLTADTRHIISGPQLAKMKPTAYLINTSRGPVVDEPALVAALQAGTIAGAGLDVFEPEPLAKDSPLRAMDNVVLTPHSAAFSDYAMDTMKQRVGQACVDIFQRRWPGIVANPTVKPRAALPPR